MTCDFQIAIHSMKFLGSLPPKELQSEKGPKNKFKKKIKKIRIYYIYIYILVLFYFIFFNVLKKPDKDTLNPKYCGNHGNYVSTYN